MAIITDMGVVEGQGILQPKLRHKWRLEFIGLDGDSQSLKVQAITCELPKLEFEDVQLDRYNSRGWVAGKHVFQPVTAVFESDVGGTVATTIQRQLERVQKIIAVTPAPLLPSTMAGQDYKFSTRIELLDGNVTVLESWALEGCYFNNVDFGDLDYSVSESLKITATIRYDHARQLITGIHGRAHNGPAPLHR